MAVTYATAVKTARMTATRDQVADGTLEIGTSGMGSVLATFGLSSTGGTVSSTTWTLAFDAATVTAAASGTAAAAQIKSSGGTALITGLTVDTSGSGADIIINSTSISSGASVTCSAGTISHA